MERDERPGGGSAFVGDALYALLALGAFAAVAAYLLLWWLVPRQDLPESAMQRLSRRYPSARRWPGIALLGIGLVIVLDRLGIWRGDVVLAFALIAGGILLYRRDGATVEGRRVDAQTSPPSPSRPASGSPAAAPSATDAAIARILPPRERSALGWTTIGVALLVVGTAVMWVAATDATPRLVTIPALALLVLAAGLVVGSVFGRARWLVLPALPLVPVVLLASAIRLPIEGGFGGLSVFPDEPSALAPEYHTTTGGIYLDLSRLRERSGDLSVTATSVLGTVQVVVPYDADVTVQGRAGLGTVSLPGGEGDSGLDVSARTRSEPRFGDGITIRLVLESGIGNVEVYREYLTPKQIRRLRQAQRRAAT